MKIALEFLCILLIALSITACEKEEPMVESNDCDVVVNANGPAFLKVINQRNKEIFVDLTKIIPLGAHMKPGACEIFGLPQGSDVVIIEQEEDNLKRTLLIEFIMGETYEIVVDNDFF